uniref:receptor protein serine/threonine kinase n=1 Tax=Trichogramma kaykai TaxID=54128 RepID=A0ABD2XQE7_9HYME
MTSSTTKIRIVFDASTKTMDEEELISLCLSNGTCAIGDLDLAIRQDQPADSIKVQVGPKRYMAPDVIEETIIMADFNFFKRADVYTLGLLIWKTARRCNVGGFHEGYELPFNEFVRSDPNVEQMHKIICVEQKRPSIPNT